MKKLSLKVLVVVLTMVLAGAGVLAVQQKGLAHEPQEQVVARVIQQEETTETVPSEKQLEKNDNEHNRVAAVVEDSEKLEQVVQDDSEKNSSQVVDTAPSGNNEKKPTPVEPVAKEKPAVSEKVDAAPAPAALHTATPAPASPYQLGQARDYTLVTRFVVKNTGDSNSTGIRLKVPMMAASSLYQVQNGESFNVQPKEIQVVQGARVGVFALKDLAPGEETVLELRYNLRVFNIKFFSEYNAVPTGNIPLGYTNATEGVESDHADIVALSRQITANLAGDWEKAEAITRWVAANITYDAEAPSRNKGALAALQTRRGVCEDYAALAAALARAAGIPARVAYGFTDNGTKWPENGAFSLAGFRHAWVEYYLDGYGWVPAEPTRSSNRLYMGSLPHNRYIVQNYNDISLKGSYKGGKLSVSWSETIEQ